MKKTILFFVIFTLYCIILFNFMTPYNITPEGNVNDFFIKSSFRSDNFLLGYKEPLAKQYNYSNFLPRGASYSFLKEEVIPQTFIGIFLIFAPLYKIFGFYEIISLLICFIGIFFFVKTLRIIFFKNKLSPFVYLIFLFPIILFWVGNVISNILTISLFFIGFYYLIKSRTEKSEKDFYLFILFSSLCLLIRYDSVILILSCLIFITKEDLKMKKIALSFIIFLLIIFPSFYYNQIYWGSPFISGYSQSSDSDLVITTLSNKSLAETIFFNLEKFFFSFLGWIFIPGFVYCLSFIKSNDIMKKKFSRFSLIVLLLLLLVFSWGRFYGSSLNSFELTQSHLRYYLPVYLIFCSYFLIFINNRLSKIGKLQSITLIILIFIGSSFFFFNQTNLSNSSDLKENNEKYLNEIISKTGNNSIIFSRLNDKLIFPYRKVVNYYGNGLYEREEHLLETCNLIKELLINNEEVYFVKEDFNAEISAERNYIPFGDYVIKCKEQSINFEDKGNNLYLIK